MPINIIRNDDKFLDVDIPTSELLPFKITEIISQNIKYNKLVSEDFDFNITINTSNILPAKLSDLHEIMKKAFKLNWAPYSSATKSYQFYTNKYKTIAEKKEQLMAIFSSIAEFEQTYKIFKEESLVDFKVDSKENVEYKDNDIHVKYIKELDSFIIIPLGFLGRDKYITMAKVSKSSIELSQINTDNSITTDEKIIKKNPKVFIVENLAYKTIKDYIEVVKKENVIFLEEQSEIIKKEVDIPFYNEKNIFDFKLELNKETNCFDFYCKGYNLNVDQYNKIVPRGLLSNIALNYILSKNIEDADTPSDIVGDDEISRNNIAKYNLELIPNKKFKSYTVPAKKINILRNILENFKRENVFFEREKKKFKIADLFLENSYMNTNQSFPTIFLDKDGKYYYAYNFRKSSKEVNVDMHGATSFLGIELSQQEYTNYINNHEWADQIKINTISLNCKVWYDKDIFRTLNNTQVIDLFSNIEMRNDIIRNTVVQKKEKKNKL